MDKFVVTGGAKLQGEVIISGAKNAAVAIIAGTVLADGICRIENLPAISDVAILTKILKELGADVKLINKNTVEIDPRRIKTPIASYDLVRKMRASYYLMGALLGKFGWAKVAMPGGCDLGLRPIDQHIKGFHVLGAESNIENGGMVSLKADKLVGGQIYLDMVSVGATINCLLASVKATGVTVIENAAKEPHIVDLANFLNSMGADIRGAGTDVIKVYGVDKLHGTTYSIIPDQIEAGTYMVAAAATCGDVLIKNVIPKHLESITAKMIEMGVNVEEYDDSVRVSRNCTLNRCNIKTMAHPGFPTDMQAQMAILLLVAEGTSIITETIFDNRFRYVSELGRMGAVVSVDGKVAVFEGGHSLTGANVKSTDLRAGAAMVIAGLIASGETTIEDIYHIERGYEDMIGKFRGLGATIKRISIPDDEEVAAV